MSKTNSEVRPSPIAGRWYPGEAAELQAAVDEYLALAAPPVRPPAAHILALIVPHAGHVFSGPVAAHAYTLLQGAAVDTVAILCPSHFHDDGRIVTTTHAAYQTPLGQVAVDGAALTQLRPLLAQALGRPPQETLAAIGHDREHAIEIELPFLQRVLAPGFTLLPLMLREQSAPLAQALGQALVTVLQGRRVLIVGSSDLSHFYTQAMAHRLDAEMLKQIAAFDPAGVLATEKAGRGFACGHGAIAATLWAAQALGAAHIQVVNYATSGDVSGDYTQVVGYGAAVAWKD